MAFDGSVGEFVFSVEDWASYTVRLEQYFAANNVEKQRAIHLSGCGTVCSRFTASPRSTANLKQHSMTSYVKGSFVEFEARGSNNSWLQNQIEDSSGVGFSCRSSKMRLQGSLADAKLELPTSSRDFTAEVVVSIWHNTASLYNQNVTTVGE